MGDGLFNPDFYNVQFGAYCRGTENFADTWIGSAFVAGNQLFDVQSPFGFNNHLESVGIQVFGGQFLDFLFPYLVCSSVGYPDRGSLLDDMQ